MTTVKKPLIDIPLGIANTAGKLLQEIANPFLTQDMIAQLSEDVLPKEDPSLLSLADVGITPASMDKVAFDYLHRFRPGGHFTQVQGYY